MSCTLVVAIPLPQYSSPIQYPRLAFLLTRSISLMLITPTNIEISLIDFYCKMYSIAKCMALQELKSLWEDLTKSSAFFIVYGYDTLNRFFAML
jgi:hypothetical protein